MAMRKDCDSSVEIKNFPLKKAHHTLLNILNGLPARSLETILIVSYLL